MTQSTWFLALLLAALAAPGCCNMQSTGNADHHRDGTAQMRHDDDGDEDRDDRDEDEDEQEIALSSVPANVLAAARAALPGATITEAEMETEHGVTVYTLEAMKGGKEYEIEVGADGRVREIEADDEGDEADDD